MILLVADLQELKANPKRAGDRHDRRGPAGQGPRRRSPPRWSRPARSRSATSSSSARRSAASARSRTTAASASRRPVRPAPSSSSACPRSPRPATSCASSPTRRQPARWSRSARPRSPRKGGEGSGRATLEDLYRQIQAGQAKELRIILKADVSGSLGAITHALEQLDQDEVRINVLHEGAGDITDNDIMLASASDAIVVGFNTKITDTARRAAEAEGVDVRLYDIIYKLTDDIDAALKGLLEPEIVEVVEGRAEVRQIFRVGKNTGHRRLVRHRRPDRPRRRPRLARRQGHRDRPDRVAAALPRRRPRGRRRTTSAASASPTSTTWKRATSSSASPRRRSARVAVRLRPRP